MPFITTGDGTQIFYNDLGKGKSVLFSHGWPPSGDDWERQMLYLGERGYRVIAHDRRSHGRTGEDRGGGWEAGVFTRTRLLRSLGRLMCWSRKVGP